MKPYIIDSITIEDAGGGNAVSYTNISTDRRRIDIMYGASLVDAEQELGNSVTIDFSVEMFDRDILTDTRITKNGADIKAPAKITMNSSQGASLSVDSIRLRLAQSVYDRECYKLSGRRSGSLMTNAQWFAYQVGLDGGSIVDYPSLNVLNSLYEASLICPCSAGSVGKLYYGAGPSELITIT